MSNKEYILNKIRRNIGEQYAMPSFDGLVPTTYANAEEQFVKMSITVGGRVERLADYKDVNELISRVYPDARVIASNVEGVDATLSPDTVAKAQDLNGTDVGVVRGEIGVAENGCIWIPQTMKERVVCFISEYLVILLDHRNIVNNMHEAYARISMNDYGYGTFISGPSKTADIAQALVMGAQAARGVTVVLV